ncbi:MAG: hypothetical protein WCN89_06570, partial [bacterium]
MGTQRQKIKNPTNKELKALEKFVVPYSNKTGDIRFHLTYPNNYWVAMSNLGFQAVYDILARDQRVIVERGFLPENSDEKEQQATKWRSFESDRLLGDCDILGFSLSFETDYSHLIRILNNQGLLFNSWQEREAAAQGKFSMPIIIAGGTAVTLNPEPVADLIDAIIVGEAEELLPEMIEVFHEAKTKGWSREQLLLGLAQIEGIYVPRFYEPHYNEHGTMLR